MQKIGLTPVSKRKTGHTSGSKPELLIAADLQHADLISQYPTGPKFLPSIMYSPLWSTYN